MLAAKHIALFLLLFLIGLTAVYAQNPVGELELKKGVVKVRRGDRDLYFRKVDVRTPLFAGDELHSGKDTSAEIFLRNGDERIRLYSRSLFKIQEVSERRSFFGMSIGKAFFKVLARLRSNKFTLQTPTATIGIKGTEFIAATDGINTFVLTTEGVVALANVDFPDKEVLVGANQASSVAPGAAPAPPIEVPQEEQAEIIEQEGTETFEQLPFLLPPPEVAEGGEQLLPPPPPPGVYLEIVSDSTEAVQPSGDVGATTSPVNINVTR